MCCITICGNTQIYSGVASLTISAAMQMFSCSLTVKTNNKICIAGHLCVACNIIANNLAPACTWNIIIVI